jgi:hypothetical protein
MDRTEAAAIAERCVERLQAASYAELKRRADEGVIDTEEITEDGREYQVEIVYLIDGPRTQTVRVLVGVDDGKWGAFAPVHRDFVKSPDGEDSGPA